MTTLTVGRVTEYPRVNLLPPEVAQAARFKRLQSLLVLLVVGALVASGALYLLASGQVSQAEQALAAAQAENASLQAEVAQYAAIPATQAALAAYEADLAEAMAPEVRWSFYLNDLSLTIPSTVRLTDMTVTEPVPGLDGTASVTTTTDGSTTSGALGTPGIATITFNGKAVSYDAVAAWLQSLAKQPGYVDAWVTSVTLDKEPETVGKVYTFQSSVAVSAEALSGRYTNTDGE